MLKSHISFLYLGVAAALVFVQPSLSFAAQAVGSVEEVAGNVTITHAGEKTPGALKTGAAIDENDVIMTSTGAHVKVAFTDKTELVIADKGSFTIDRYIYDPAKPGGNKAKFSILGAAFYYVGGLMEKSAASNVSIDLDLGSIGIRGTKLMRAMKNGECWIYLEDGKITVSNKGGVVNLTPGEGTIMRAKTQAPQAPRVWTAKEIGWIKEAVFGQSK